MRRRRNTCPKKGKAVAPGRAAGPGAAGDGPRLAVGGISAVPSNLLQSLLAEELTFEFVSE